VIANGDFGRYINTMDRNTTIGLLRRHADELRKRGVTGMYLFGSMARGDAKEQSDVDIFFDYKQDGHFSLFDVMDIQEFVETVLNTKADVIPRSCLHRYLRDAAVEDAIQIF
jgi:predicted nucleotidyltransferase